MTSCCDEKSCELEKLPKSQSKVLWIVLSINLLMFLVELGAGFFSSSLSLAGDSLDMLGDAVAYGSSLYVLNLGVRAKAKSAMVKGSLILVSAVAVLIMAVYRTFFQTVPEAPIMGVVGVSALVANLVCLALLTKHKNDDVNMSSVWLCSRNDIIANVSVLLAAGAVFYTNTPWPDLIVGIGLTGLFTRSAWKVFADARKVLNPSSALV